MDMALAATGLRSLLGAVEALREAPLSSPWLSRLGYTDTELLMAATAAGGAVLLTGDELLALEAQEDGVNAYAIVWLLSLSPGDVARLLCPRRRGSRS